MCVCVDGSIPSPDPSAADRIAKAAARKRGQLAIGGVWFAIEVVNVDIVLDFAAAAIGEAVPESAAVLGAIGVVHFDRAIVADVQVSTRIIPNRTPGCQTQLYTAAWFSELPVRKPH